MQVPSFSRGQLHFIVDGRIGESSCTFCSLFQELNLARSHLLAEVSISSPHLTSLNLSGCTALTELDLRCAKLDTLKLAQCTGLKGLGEYLCPALKKLSIPQYQQLTSEALSDLLAGAPLLEELNCSGCPALSRLDLAANSRLTKLDVSGCNLLPRLVITSPALVSLNARDCSEQRELRADSEGMEELLLNDCRLLDELDLPVLAVMSARCEAGMDVQLDLDARGCDSLPAPVIQKLRDIGGKTSMRPAWPRVAKGARVLRVDGVHSASELFPVNL